MTKQGSTLAWARVADTILSRIASGEYQDRLPSRDALAAEFGVCNRTAARGYRHLAERNIIYRRGVLGYYVWPAGSGGPGADPMARARVTAMLLSQIASGDLKPWTTVPVIADLATAAGCGGGPVTRALTALARQGVLRRVPGHGYMVLPAADSQAGQQQEEEPEQELPSEGDLREWARAVRVLTGRIASGELKTGDFLPSKPALAAELGVSPGTVSRAFGELAHRGIIWRRAAERYRVSGRSALDSTGAASATAAEGGPR